MFSYCINYELGLGYASIIDIHPNSVNFDRKFGFSLISFVYSHVILSLSVLRVLVLVLNSYFIILYFI